MVIRQRRQKEAHGRAPKLPGKEQEGAKGDSGGLVAARLPPMLRNPVAKRQQERETGGRKQCLIRERSRGAAGGRWTRNGGSRAGRQAILPRLLVTCEEGLNHSLPR